VGACIGIDLGSVSSYAAVIKDGEVVHLTPAEGIPSIVTVGEAGELEVGAAAANRLNSDPLAGLWGSKRLLGQTQKVIDEVRQLFTYDVVDGDDSEIALRLCNHTVSLKRVTTSILKEVIRIAGEKLDEPIRAAVIATPTNFTATQRSALRAAVEASGIELLEFINEPTATALAFGHNKEKDERVAVFDLGGGTLDISVVDIKGDEYQIVASGGDTFLGGIDFDQSLSNWITERHQCDKVSLSSDSLGPLSVERIRKGAEQAKISLSNDDTYPLTILGVGNDNSISDLELVIERSDLERVTFSLVQESMKSLKRVADIAESSRPIDTLLMVGGQSQMPLIVERAKGVLPECETPQIDPTRTVCAGAAILAEALSHLSTSPKKVAEIVSQEISIKQPSGALFALFPVGTQLPARQPLALTTHMDNQTSIELSLVQTSDGEIVSLKEVSIGPLEKLPAGEVVHELIFVLNRGGELSIEGLGDLLGSRDDQIEKDTAEEVLEDTSDENTVEESTLDADTVEHSLDFNDEDNERLNTEEYSQIDLESFDSPPIKESLPWDETEETQELLDWEGDWPSEPSPSAQLLPRPIPGIHTKPNRVGVNANNPMKWMREFFKGLFGG